MKVLIACEYSGRVRDAFLAAGHYQGIAEAMAAQWGSVLPEWLR